MLSSFRARESRQCLCVCACVCVCVCEATLVSPKTVREIRIGLRREVAGVWMFVFVFVCACDISRHIGTLLAGVQESRRFLIVGM